MDQPVGNNVRYLLSDYVKKWYSCILPDISLDGPYRHPHFLLKGRHNGMGDRAPERVVKRVVDGKIDLKDANIIWTSGETSRSWLNPLKTLRLSRYLEAMPLMTSSDVLLGENKLCRLMTFDEIEWHCVVELVEPVSYIKALDTIQKLAAKFTYKNSEALIIRTIDDWAVVCDEGKVYFVTPFYGQTVAQRWITLSARERQRLLGSLRSLALYFEEQGLYWRDFAPRNMLCPSADEIILIDFEHLIDIDEIPPSERVVLDKCRRIWFGDMLSQPEIDFLFGAMPTYAMDADMCCEADRLELAYFDRPIISFAERLALLDMVSEVERAHYYGGSLIHGHRIGLYMSDFLNVRTEAALYKILARLSIVRWPTVLNALQQCIDFDQFNYIMSLYNIGVVTNSTEIFINDMDTRELSDSSLDNEVTQWIQQHNKQHGVANN